MVGERLAVTSRAEKNRVDPVGFKKSNCYEGGEG
jgi:hypothetical protein